MELDPEEISEKRLDQNEHNNDNNNNQPVHNVNSFVNMDGLKCLYTNADSLLNKIAELKLAVQNYRPHIIAVTEMRKTRKTPIEDAEIQIQDYDIFRSNLNSNLDRGCIIYTHRSLQANSVKLIGNHNDAVWCHIKLINNDSLLVGCLYRSPNNSPEANNHFIEMFNSMLQNNTFSHLLIMGDFNYPKIDWNSWSTNIENVEDPSNIFIETIKDHYLYQHVQQFTRGRGKDQPHILDLILTNEEDMIDHLEYLSPLGKSDTLF